MNDDTGGIAADFSLLMNIVPFPEMYVSGINQQKRRNGSNRHQV
jgi:hypothetical protein